MKAKRHHFLPQFYLELFTSANDENLLWVYDKHGGSPRKQKPLNTAVEGHLYSVTGHQGEKDDTLESRIFSKLDGRTKPVLQRLSHPDGRPEEGDLEALIDFIAIQHVRVPRAKRVVEEIGIAAAKARQEYLADNPKSLKKFLDGFNKAFPSNGGLSIEEYQDFVANFDERLEMRMNPELSMMLSIASSKVVFDELCSMRLELVFLQEGEQFITCDAPVVVFLPGPCGHAAFGGGLAEPGVEVFFPVCPSVGVFFDRRPPRAKVASRRAFAKSMNRRLACNANRFLYSQEFDQQVLDLVREFSKTAKGPLVNSEEIKNRFDWSRIENALDHSE